MRQEEPHILDDDDYTYLQSKARPKDSQRPPRKIFARLFGVLALLSLLIYFGAQSGTIVGLMRSTTLDGNQLSHGNVTIHFNDNVLSSLQSTYLEEADREIKACLEGMVLEEDNGLSYQVTGITYPEVISSSVVHITTSMCPESTIIVLHSHPLNRCVASDQDMRTLKRYHDVNPHILALIMCNIDRFSVY